MKIQITSDEGKLNFRIEAENLEEAGVLKTLNQKLVYADVTGQLVVGKTETEVKLKSSIDIGAR